MNPAKDPTANRPVGFLEKGHDLPSPFRLPMVRGVQVDAHNDD